MGGVCRQEDAAHSGVVQTATAQERSTRGPRRSSAIAIRFVHEDGKRGEIPIDVQIAGDLPPIFVEQIQIQEVLINLISNGIEAMESNARPPHLMIRARLVNESGGSD